MEDEKTMKGIIRDGGGLIYMIRQSRNMRTPYGRPFVTYAASTKPLRKNREGCVFSQGILATSQSSLNCLAFVHDTSEEMRQACSMQNS